MMRAALVAIALLALGLGLFGLFASRATEAPMAAQSGSSVVEALSSMRGTEGFSRALSPRPFVFPIDAGPHPDFHTEWWYYTGNLDAADGAHYGYQLTFFRRALTPRPTPRSSEWAASQAYFAHFAVTDVIGGAFHADERWSRGAAGLAGARAAPRGGGASFDAWVESWSARMEGDGVHLRARTGEVAIDLRLRPEKGAAPQGERGLSRKSGERGNASYYYSVPRLATTGTVTIGARTASVSGSSWLDREWSTRALSKDQAGWDWFSLQLSDGRDVMLYRLRRADGSTDPHSMGSVMIAGTDVEAKVRRLDTSSYSIESTSTWPSPHTGAIYPGSWHICIPSENLDLYVEPWLPDQELRLSFAYWEGAVRIRGSDGLTGNGYVELTGYAGPAGSVSR